MAGMELQRVRQGRPTQVTDSQGCIIFISTHDDYFLKTQKAYKRKLASLHPDIYSRDRRYQVKNVYRGGYFRDCMVAYCSWLDKEVQWYKNFGLELPTRDL